MMTTAFQWIKKKGFEYRGPLLSGFLIGTTYIPFPPWALLFCYVPLWLFLAQGSKSIRQVFFGAWITQIFLTLIGFHWIAYTAHEFASIPWILSAIVVFLFAAVIHLYIPLAALFSWGLKKRFDLSPMQTLFVLALSFSLAERFWPSIFPWYIGYTLLWAKMPIYQLADMVGFEGLSSVILLFNAWMAAIWLMQKKQGRENRKAVAQLIILLFVFLALNGWGQLHKLEWDETDAQIHANIIQANIGNLEKVAAEKGRGYQGEIIQKFLTMSKESLDKYPNADLLIWPETAYPDYLDESFLRRKNQIDLIIGLAQLKTPLLTGAYSKDPTTDIRRDQSTYNALFLVNNEGHSYSDPYRKTYLLAFGEYLPLSEQFPMLLKVFPFISNFGRGLGPATLELPSREHPEDKVKIGGQICYEGLYPNFSRGLALKGADILVNVTNDSWFGRPFEPNQHLYMTLARAIEVRRPLLRSTNTGISTGILANGDVLLKSPIHEEWVGQFTLPYRKNAELTFFVRYGHWDWILLILAIIMIAGGARARSGRS